MNRQRLTLTPVQLPGSGQYASPPGKEHWLEPVGQPVAFLTNFPGYFLGGARYVQFVPNGTPASLQVRVWRLSDALRYEDSRGPRGWSDPILVPVASDMPPDNMAGLASFDVGCPDCFAWISQHPTGQVASLGGIVTLESDGWPGRSGSYQWRKDGSVISGATNKSLTLANVQFSDAGNYAVLYSYLASREANVAVAFGPALNPPNIRATGEAGIMVTSLPGATITLETSTNLASWKTVATATNSTGSMEFLDSTATNFPHRFYRAVSQP